MIVICTCGQKSRVPMGFFVGEKTAKDIRCKICKTSLVPFVKEQAERNSKIVLAIVELFMEEHPDKSLAESLELVFRSNGYALPDPDADEDEDEDTAEDEDDEVIDDEEEEEEAPKKKTKKKKKTSAKSSRHTTH